MTGRAMASKGRRKQRVMMSERKALELAEKTARRLAGNVAIEMNLAGGQVLREEFGFTHEQIKRWVDLTIERARKNREGEETE